jgi:hypothetical protein
MAQELVLVPKDKYEHLIRTLNNNVSQARDEERKVIDITLEDGSLETQLTTTSSASSKSEPYLLKKCDGRKVFRGSLRNPL